MFAFFLLEKKKYMISKNNCCVHHFKVLLVFINSIIFICRLYIDIVSFFFFFNDTATTEIYTLSLHDALPIRLVTADSSSPFHHQQRHEGCRSEEHTSELQSRFDLVCRLLLEKKKNKRIPLHFAIKQTLIKVISSVGWFT